jgi:hypothetical protein
MAKLKFDNTLCESVDNVYKKFKDRSHKFDRVNFNNEYNQLNMNVSVLLYEQYRNNKFRYNLICMKKQLEKSLKAIESDNNRKHLIELDAFKQSLYFLKSECDLYLEIDVSKLDKLPLIPGNAVILNVGYV